MKQLTWIAAGVVLASLAILSARPSKVESPPSVAATAQSVQFAAITIDGMHCPSGCYPTVRSTIAEQPGVLEVTLAPQKDIDVIDNPVVLVTHRGDLDFDALYRAVERAGYEPKSHVCIESPSSR